MKKWFITDMDGTFLNSKKEISPDAPSVMKELQQKGIKFIIATGRPDIAVKNYYYSLGMDDVVISNNGSLIRNLKTGEVVYQKSFTDYEIETIWQLFKEFGDDSIEFHIYTLNYIYCDRLSFSMARMKKFEEKFADELKTPMMVVEGDTLEAVKKNNEACQKVMMISKDHDKLEKFYAIVKEKLNVDGTFSAKDFFDIMPAGCNKGSAIEKLASYYGYDVAYCVVFGDDFNDVQMLEVAGTSVCPSNARTEIKNICDEVIGSNEDFSVLKYVKDYADSIKITD